MELTDRLSQEKQAIVGKWISKVLESYPALKKNKNQFANPLLHIISKNLELLFNQLLEGIDNKTAAPILENIIRVKAVQDFSPSQGISFIFDLKQVIREYLSNEPFVVKLWEELLTIESQIDTLALLSFDIYARCREKLFEIKINEIRNQTHMLIRRVNEMDEQKEER